jgi:elongation factor P
MQSLRGAPSRCAPASTSRPLARRLVIRAGGTVSTNDFRNGLTVEIDSQPYKVVEFLHVKPGKGAAFVRSKLKNFLTGGVVEKTFRAGEQVNTADIVKRDGQFTYLEGDDYVFMDTETYEETRLKRDDWANFLKEGTTVELLFYNSKVISVSLPQFMDLKVGARPHAPTATPTRPNRNHNVFLCPCAPALRSRWWRPRPTSRATPQLEAASQRCSRPGQPCRCRCSLRLGRPSRSTPRQASTCLAHSASQAQ